MVTRPDEESGLARRRQPRGHRSTAPRPESHSPRRAQRQQPTVATPHSKGKRKKSTDVLSGSAWSLPLRCWHEPARARQAEEHCGRTGRAGFPATVAQSAARQAFCKLGYVTRETIAVVPRPRRRRYRCAVLHGWETNERVLESGAFESRQRVLARVPLVEHSESGARWLGLAYWQAVGGFTHGGVARAGRGGGRSGGGREPSPVRLRPSSRGPTSSFRVGTRSGEVCSRCAPADRSRSRNARPARRSR